MQPRGAAWRVILLMGVSGSGKSTIGRLLADQHGFAFVDADAYHSRENVARMRRGEPLDDAVRAGWLALLRDRIDRAFAQHETIALACSALKAAYRARLGLPRPGAALVYLRIPRDEALVRVDTRTDHFMPASLVASQFDTLEEPPEDAIVIDALQPPATIIRAIGQRLGLP